MVNIDGDYVKAKIVWKGGSKFKIIECENGSHTDKIIDACDVLHCRL